MSFALFYYFRVPEDCRDFWFRNNGLLWKNVKDLFICSLHFEANCFSAKGRLLRSATPNGSAPSNNNDKDERIAKLEIENKKFQDEINRLKAENSKLKDSARYLKRKCSEQDIKVQDLQKAVKDLEGKFSLSDDMINNLSKSAATLPLEIFQQVNKKIKTGRGRSKSVHPANKIK